MDNSDKLVVLLNLAMCFFGAWVCICRMGMMTGRNTKKAVRIQYAMLFLAFVISGGSYWLFSGSPTEAQIIMGMLILGHLLLGWGAWRNGAPLYTMRGN